MKKKHSHKTSLSFKPGLVTKHIKSKQQHKFHSLFTAKLSLSLQGTELTQDRNIASYSTLFVDLEKQGLGLLREKDRYKQEGGNNTKGTCSEPATTKPQQNT